MSRKQAVLPTDGVHVSHIRELAEAAARAIEAGQEHVLVTVPRTCRGSRRMVVFKQPRLTGEVACVSPSGHTALWVDAMSLLAWLAAAGLIRVEARFEEEPK